ncbi:N-acetylglucosaminyl transferase component-domain-containing protein [Hyaloraphidium curvatum]|nr:N-acetylglucosaminyl transferase component-domain-containing protein [Hyaloraphidium curvatum]
MMPRDFGVPALAVFWNARVDEAAVRRGRTLLVGWQLSDSCFCVCGAADIAKWTRDALEDALVHVHGLSAGLPRPHVLGTVRAKLLDDANDRPPTSNGTKAAHGDVHLQFSVSGKLPQLEHYLLDSRPVRVGAVQVILFSEPDVRHGQFFSLEPMVLDLSRYAVSDLQSATSISHLPPSKADLFHPAIRDLSSLAALQDDAVPFELAVDLMNSAHAVHKQIVPTLDSRSAASPAALLQGLVRGLVALTYPVRLLLYAVLAASKPASDALIAALRYPVPLGAAQPVKALDFSVACQQVELRVQQASFWHTQIAHLWDSGARDLAKRHAEYINFNNTLWLIANDVIFGFALGGILVANADSIAALLDGWFTGFGLDYFRGMTVWLMGWPAGLKLNAPLSRFMGELFLWLLGMWEALAAAARPHLVDAVVFLGSSGVFGATMVLSLLADLIALSTLHINLFYRVAAKIYHWQFSALVSLFYLFQGRKRNVLRGRVDLQDYPLEQLVIGTMLFTVLMFLFPTTFVYYLLFTTARIVVVAVQVALEVALAVLNHFPLFAVTLRAKNGSRIPGGLRLKATPAPSGVHSPDIPTVHLSVANVPMSLGSLFFQTSQIMGQLSDFYLGPATLVGLLTGVPLQQVGRLRYLFLPGGTWGHVTELRGTS